MSTSEVRTTGPKRRTCLRLCKMILSAFPSMILGVFTIVFTLQQQYTARENRKQDQIQADELNIRSTFTHYINDISELLLNRKFNRTNPEHLLQIRVKTMTALRYVDTKRKRDIILFLYDSRLLRSDLPESERLNLIDADLSHVSFIGSRITPMVLHSIFLRGIYASKIIFQWCKLDGAIFDDSSMADGKIIDSSIYNTSFRRIYAPDLNIQDVIFYKNNFEGATLSRLKLMGGIDIRKHVDFTNADLIDSHLLRNATVNLARLPSEIATFLNTRLPDGTFININQSNIVIDGEAEETCQMNMSNIVWFSEFQPPMQITNVSDAANFSSLGNCSFVSRSQELSLLTQRIIVSMFSVLIDSGHAAYNLSAFLGCLTNLSGTVGMSIHFMSENGIWISGHTIFSTSDLPRMWSKGIGPIPITTRVLELLMTVSVGNSSNICLIDNISLNIFYNRTDKYI